MIDVYHQSLLFETKPQLNRPECQITLMEIYFINQGSIPILLNNESMNKHNLFDLTNDDIHSSFPVDPNIGDTCLYTNVYSPDMNWYLGKIAWQDFDFEKINRNTYGHLSEVILAKSHYLFTSYKSKYGKITEAYEYMFEFCNRNELQITTILEIYPTAIPKSNDDEIVVDIYLAIENDIPKPLLKQYQPFKIRRRKYNFFTY